MQAFYPTTDAFGAILPSNSPGVHSLWVPALALKTPARAQARPRRAVDALPRAAIVPASRHPGLARSNFFPTDHAGAGRVSLAGRPQHVVRRRPNHRSVQERPPGRTARPGLQQGAHRRRPGRQLARYLDVDRRVASRPTAAEPASTSPAVWTPRHGKAIAEALAKQLASSQSPAVGRPGGRARRLRQPRRGRWLISAMVDEGLKTPGAEDVTEQHPRHAAGSCATAAAPGCCRPSSPATRRSTRWPTRNSCSRIASVVECPQDEMLKRIGPTLAAMALTDDEAFTPATAGQPAHRTAERRPDPDNRLTWDQPHEGNLFTHLYRQRAFQHASRALAGV